MNTDKHRSKTRVLSALIGVHLRLNSLLWASLLLCATGTLAQAEHLVFTTVVPGTCPVWFSAPEKSKDFGFQSLEFLNDSDKSLQFLRLKVTFATDKREQEEVVDGGYVAT